MTAITYLDVSNNPLFNIQPEQLLHLKLRTLIVENTFIPIRPDSGRPSLFMEEYINFLVLLYKSTLTQECGLAQPVPC